VKGSSPRLLCCHQGHNHVWTNAEGLAQKIDNCCRWPRRRIRDEL